MREQFTIIRNGINALIDFFYPPFSRVLDKQTFRYAACGGSNTLFDIALYFITYNFILKKEIVHAGTFAISPHIAAFIFTFPVTFISGFLLARYIVFPEASSERKRIQVAKYLSIVLVCILLNYGCLKLFVEALGWWPLPAKLATTVVVVAFSYFSQKNYAFRKPAT